LKRTYLFAIVLAACKLPLAECVVLCGQAGRCPRGLSCGQDGYCHSDGTRDGCPERDAGAIGPAPQFAAAASYPVGAQPLSLAVGDFNHDRIDDLAVGNQGSGINVFKGTKSALAGPSPVAQSGLGTIATGDFNNDGNLDLVASVDRVDAFSFTGVLVLWGSSSGAFSASFGAEASGPAHGFQLNPADFNGDRKLDIAMLDSGDDLVNILLGDGAGSFAPMTTTGGSQPRSLATSDLNQDGHLDLVVGHFGGMVTTLLGIGNGSFHVGGDFPSGGSDAWGLGVGDLDGDGFADVVTANANDDTASVLYGNGDGTLQAAVPYATGMDGHAVAIADFNEDRLLDFAVANFSSGSVSVFRNLGGRTFDHAIDFPCRPHPEAIAAGDYNGDGKIDLAVTNSADGTLCVLINALAW
jgi:hypothetical protein